MDVAGVVEQMLAAGLPLPPQPLRLDGKVVRFGADGARRGKRNSWYVLRELRRDSGSYVVVGSFGDWGSGLSQRVAVDWQGINEAEREALRERARQQQQAADAERRQAAALAAMSAAQLWREGAPVGSSPYLKRKGLDGESCRYLRDGSLLVPLLRYDMPREQALRAVQRIFPDGSKRFTKGFDKPGTSVRLGTVVDGAPILICEGYATGLTLRVATDRRLPVYVALDAGNLLSVAQLLRELYPAAPLLLCADDDWRTRGPDGRLLNVGRVKAKAAAREVGAAYVYPAFKPANRQPKDTDFDDLRQRAGLAEVTAQLRAVLRAITPESVARA